MTALLVIGAVLLASFATARILGYSLRRLGEVDYVEPAEELFP